MLPALAGATVMAILWVAGEFLPNCGFWSWIGAIPYMFYYSGGEDIPSITSGGQALLVWVLANAFFALGPMVAFMFSRGKAALIFSSTLLLASITHGCLSIALFIDYLGRWIESPVTIGQLLMNWPLIAWMLGLCIGGAAIGIALPRIARAVARRSARRRTALCR